MLTPRNSNTPTPRPPRDQDEWIAILVALGVLGGTAGWIILGGSLPSLRLGTVNADRPDTEVSSAPTPDNSQTNITSESSDPEEQMDTAAESETDTTVSSEGLGDAVQAQPNNQAQPDNGILQTPSLPITSQPANVTQPGIITTPDGEEGTQTAPSATEPSEDSSESLEPSTSSVAVPEPVVPEGVTEGTLIPLRDPLVFSDLPDDHWGKPYIDSLTALGILNGFPDGSYAPDRPMTRAELAVQVAQAFDLESTLPAETFTDVPEGYWAASTIEEAVTTGFMKGYPNSVFQPDQTVPRVQVLVTLATGLTLPDASTPENTLQQYNDQTAIPEWARTKVASAVNSGLIGVASDDSIDMRPNAPATRAEVAAMLHSALVYLGKVEPIE